MKTDSARIRPDVADVARDEVREHQALKWHAALDF